MASTKIITDLSALNKEIKGIVTTAGKLQDRIHAALLSCALQIKEHGNSTPLCMLVGKLPQGQRTASIQSWFVKYVPGQFVAADGDVPIKFRLDKEFDRAKIDVTEMDATRYWDKAETIKKPLELKEWLATMAKIATYEAEEGKAPRYTEELVEFAAKVLPAIKKMAPADAE